MPTPSPPSISPRSASTRCVIGLTFVKLSSQLGSVSTGTKMPVANVSGIRITNMIPCTAPGVRTIIPMNTAAHDRHSANAIASRQAASTSGALVSARKPRM